MHLLKVLKNDFKQESIAVKEIQEDGYADAEVEH